jgi:tetratricopeptide (TPR) repeat protein
MALLLCSGAAIAAGQTNDFYLALLSRGIAHFDSGNYEAAVPELRIAAFGLVDDLSRFEIAQIYIGLASDKLKHETEARHAANRLLAAERIEPHYATLQISDATRAAFEKLVQRILTSDQVAVLHAKPQANLSRPVVPVPQPQPGRPVPAPTPVRPQPVPQTVVPAPQPQKPQKPITSSPAPKSPIELPSPAPRSEVAPPIIRKPDTPIIAPPSVRTPEPQPQPRVVQPQPQPQPRVVVPPPVPQPRGIQPAPAPVIDPDRALEERVQHIEARESRPALSAQQIDRLLSNADAALAKDDLSGAITIYRELIEAPSLTHAVSMRIAEGAYRARDFNTAIRAFERAGGFRKGEEPYGYYLSVALYETGRYAAAKRELDTALKFIDVTPDVARYRAKIYGAID